MELELQNFSSIFEIFTAFTLAYIIIDELVENPFVSTVTDKILKIFRPVDEVFNSITAAINGRKTSLDNLTPLIIERKDDQNDLKNKLKEHQDLIGSIENRCTQAYNEIKSSIRGSSYTTKVFVYLNTYLFMYCLMVLFIGGCYDNENKNIHIIDTLLLIIELFTILFLSLGWYFDTQKSNNKKGWLDWIYGISYFNGYILSFACILLLITTSIILYHFNIYFFITPKWFFHNSIIITAVLLPVFNFLIYIRKAHKRSKKSLPDLVSKAKTYECDYTNELEIIDNFIGMCKYTYTNGSVNVTKEDGAT